MAKLLGLDVPPIRDRNALKEYAEALSDHAPEVESDIAQLKRVPNDKKVIANLFRTLHNIKGDAALCKVDIGVAIVHPIETLLDRIRSGKLEFTELLGEVILLAVDRLELAIEALTLGKSVSGLKLANLVQALDELSQANHAKLDNAARQLIQLVTGFLPAAAPLPTKPKKPAIRSRAQVSMAEHLKFFRSLAQQFENRSSHFKGRTDRILHLAQETNKAAGKPVDPIQLEAAIYMHDIGMMFLPESVWLKLDRLNDEDKKALQAHPGYGAGLLERMTGWEPAAEMVLQHHEMPDGAGYPNNLKMGQICSGAKILAIVDAFEAVMLKHTHRGHSRSILRAISEVNACDNQFAKEWIEPFNQVIRKLIES